jgi:hypothetical protein
MDLGRFFIDGVYLEIDVDDCSNEEVCIEIDV